MSWDDAVWVVEPVDVAALLPVPGRWQRWNRAGTAVMLTELSHPTYRWEGRPAAAPPPPMTADERKAGAASLRVARNDRAATVSCAAQRSPSEPVDVHALRWRRVQRTSWFAVWGGPWSATWRYRAATRHRRRDAQLS